MKKRLVIIISFVLLMQIGFSNQINVLGYKKTARLESNIFNRQECIKILSVNCMDYPALLTFSYNDGCRTVLCFSELTDEQCNFFKLNTENDSFYYNSTFILQNETKKIGSTEYILAKLELFNESEPCSSFVTFKVLEQHFDSIEPYVLIQNASGEKCILNTSNKGATYPIGMCFIQEVYKTWNQNNKTPNYCPVSDKKIQISRLSGEFCMSVVQILETKKALFWIVQDGYGLRYAVVNGSHNKKTNIDLSEKKQWSIKFENVSRIIQINGQDYPLLSVENYKYLFWNECFEVVEKGKGQPLSLRFQVIRAESDNLGIKAFDENGSTWVLVGSPEMMLDLEKGTVCIYAKGEGFYAEKSAISPPDTFLVESWEYVDCKDFIGGKLLEGKILKIRDFKGEDKSNIPKKIISIQMFAGGAINDYFADAETIPLKGSDLRIDDCVQFNSINGLVSYCERIQCKKMADPKSNTQIKGWLDFAIGLSITGIPFYWIYLTSCEGEEITLIYPGDNPPNDRKTGKKLNQYKGCAVFGLKNSNLEWWETSTEPCCNNSSMGLRTFSNQSLFFLKCDKKPLFQISFDNNSQSALTVSVKPRKSTKPFLPILPFQIMPGERRIAETEPEKLEDEAISKYYADVFVNDKLIKTLTFIVINQKINDCVQQKNIEFVIPRYPDPSCAGKKVTFEIFATNKYSTKPIKLNFDSKNPESGIIFQPPTVDLAPWETKQVTATLIQPDNVLKNDINIQFTSFTNDRQQIYELSVVSKYKEEDICKPCCDFELDAPEITANLCQNEEKTFKINVSNACGKEKQTFKVQSLTDSVPLSIEPNSFELEAGESEEISVKVKQPSNEEEIKWKLGVYASCGTTKSLEFTTKIKTVEECDPCYGFGFRFYEPLKVELCEGEEGNVLVFLYNSNTTKTMDAQIKVVVNSEKPETIEKNEKLLPNTKASVALIYKQPKKTNKEYVEIHTSVSFCGKIETNTHKSFYKPDSVCKPCCDFKIEIDKKEFSKVKAGDKLKAILTITNTCNLSDQYTISGSAGISFSVTKLDLQPGKSQNVTLLFAAPKAKTKSQIFTVTVSGCKGKTNKPISIKLNYT